MAMTHTETIGFCTEVSQLIEETTEILREEGIDSAKWVTEITGKKNLATTKNAEQNDLKAQLKTKTAEAQNAVDDAYKSASTRLDALIGIVGKTTPLGKQAAKLRSNINKKSKKAAPKP
jgi:hypothetical protein